MVNPLGLRHLIDDQRLTGIRSGQNAFGMRIRAFPKQMKHSEISPNYVNKSPTFGPTNNALTSIAKDSNKDAHRRVDVLERDGSG
jgi:hypothetical protein